jgi:hypothetical protein
MELIKINKSFFKAKGKASVPDGKVTITAAHTLYISKWIIAMGLVNPKKLYEIFLTKEDGKITSINFQERKTDENNNCYKILNCQNNYQMSITGLCNHYGIKPGRYQITNLTGEGQNGFIIYLT